jgi:hypothetical protein
MFLSTTKNVKNLYLAVILYLGYHGNGSHFEKKFNTPQKLPHTTVDIPTKFHEV